MGLTDAIQAATDAIARAEAITRRRELHRQTMRRSDQLLDRLERLNWADRKVVPQRLRKDIREFCAGIPADVIDLSSVQAAVDSMLDLQETLMPGSPDEVD